jgi:hypothetical protein
MQINWVKPYKLNDDTGEYSGGLVDIGNFREGFCFKLYLRNDAVWALCASSFKEKNEWI